MPTIPEYLITPPAFAKIALGLRLYEWQERVLWDLNLAPVAVALRAANESGKTSVIGATAALFNAVAFPGSLTIATASVYRQISEQFFPTIHKHAAAFPGGVFNATDVTLANGSKIFGFATDEASKFEGWHNPHLLIIADEAKGISDSIFEAIERCAPQRFLLMSSPGGCSGFFYEAFKSKRKFFRTHVVTAFMCPHIARERIDSQIVKYGREHPLIQSMIFGEFMTGDADGCAIPLAFVERLLANPPAFVDNGDVQAFTDFAAGGDENVLAVRRGNRVELVACWREPDTMKAVGRFIQLFQEQKLEAHQIAGDAGGLGIPILDRLAENGWQIRRVNNGSPASKPEAYANVAAETWFEARVQIERGQIILPNDPELVAQLTSRKGWPDSKGRLQLESKADMRSRGLSSPDKADAVLGAIARLSTGTGWTAEAVAKVRAAFPEIFTAAATQPELNRELARQPYRINAPGTQYPAPSNPLARMGQFTPRRWK
jgi:hypothetical protein